MRREPHGKGGRKTIFTLTPNERVHISQIVAVKAEARNDMLKPLTRNKAA